MIILIIKQILFLLFPNTSPWWHITESPQQNLLPEQFLKKSFYADDIKRSRIQFSVSKSPLFDKQARAAFPCSEPGRERHAAESAVFAITTLNSLQSPAIKRDTFLVLGSFGSTPSKIVWWLSFWNIWIIFEFVIWNALFVVCGAFLLLLWKMKVRIVCFVVGEWLLWRSFKGALETCLQMCEFTDVKMHQKFYFDL